MRHTIVGYCNYPENGGGGHVDYCDNKLPCFSHDRPRTEPTRHPSTPVLFEPGVFTAAAGEPLQWKIECDALTLRDWRALALAASTFLPRFRVACGVPSGGTPFASQLALYATSDPTDPVLLADDVWTTGKSMSGFAAELSLHLQDWIGIVAFARGPIWDGWENKVFPIFSLFQAPLTFPAPDEDPGLEIVPEVVEAVKKERDPRHTCTAGLIGSWKGCPICNPEEQGWQLETTRPLRHEQNLPEDPDDPYVPHVFRDLGNPFSCGICGYPRFAPLHGAVRS